MKQRLGIACALLSSPDLLVLDEPSNGLDPAGMVDMRSLIRRIAASGDATVLVSSHLLAEMEQVCDRVAIIAKGRLVASGSPSELAALVVGSSLVSVEVTDPQRAIKVLRGLDFDVRLNDSASALLVEESDQRRVLSTLVSADVEILGVTRAKDSLESTFLALTKEYV
jgi:ABC-2 type transport system ATP-binding protein